MKRLLTLFFLLVFVVVLYPQQNPKYSSSKKEETPIKKEDAKSHGNSYLAIGADPVEWDRVLKPGEMLVKTATDLYVNTSGRTKRYTGYLRKGYFAIVDASDFWTKGVTTFTIAECGNNDTYALQPGTKGKTLVKLDRSNCIPIAYYQGNLQYDFSRDSLVNSPYAVLPDSSWLAGMEGRIMDGIFELGGKIDAVFAELNGRIASLNDKVNSLSPEGFGDKTVWDTCWPWVIGGAIVAGTVTYFICKANRVKEREIVIDRSGWMPPNDPPLGKRFSFGVSASF